jgi:hypothetical protein
MRNPVQHLRTASLSERKQQLIAQGEAFRAEIVGARNHMRLSLRPEALAKGAITQIAAAGAAAFKNGGAANVAANLAALDVQTILPLVTAGVSALSRMSKSGFLKPVMRTIVVLGAAGTAVAMIIKWKKSRGTTKPEGRFRRRVFPDM